MMAIVRTALGPTAFDRVLSVNVIGTLIILGIALHGFIMERPEFVDISILYAIFLNFIGTFAVLKLFSTGSLGDDRDEEEGMAMDIFTILFRICFCDWQRCDCDWGVGFDHAERCVFTYPCRWG